MHRPALAQANSSAPEAPETRDLCRVRGLGFPIRAPLRGYGVAGLGFGI